MLPSSVRFNPSSGKIRLFHPQARFKGGCLPVEVEFSPEELLELLAEAHEAVDQAYDHETRVMLTEAVATVPPVEAAKEEGPVRIGIVGV